MSAPDSHRVPTFYTISEVAEHLKVSPKTVRRWIDRGELAAHRFSRQIRVSETDMAAFIAAHRK